MRLLWTKCNWSMCQGLKYLECDLDESGTNDAEYRRKVARGRNVAGTIDPWSLPGVCNLSV